MIQEVLYYQYNVPGSFGIKFQIPIYVGVVSSKSYVNIISYIKKNIINTKFYEKDQLSLDDNYWNKYNIFDIDELDTTLLKNEIIKSYYVFMDIYKTQKEQEIWINGWANVLSKGNGLKIHMHGDHENSYLSGNIILSDTKIPTDFLMPQFEHMNDYGKLRLTNPIGGINMFPQWLYHEAINNTEDIRITLAFDLFTKNGIEYYNLHKNNMPISRAIRLI
jgi:hypothetical protein